MLHIHNRILPGLDKDEKENLNKIDGSVKDIQSKVAHCQNGQCLSFLSCASFYTWIFKLDCLWRTGKCRGDMRVGEQALKRGKMEWYKRYRE